MEFCLSVFADTCNFFGIAFTCCCRVKRRRKARVVGAIKSEGYRDCGRMGLGLGMGEVGKVSCDAVLLLLLRWLDSSRAVELAS